MVTPRVPTRFRRVLAARAGVTLIAPLPTVIRTSRAAAPSVIVKRPRTSPAAEANRFPPAPGTIIVAAARGDRQRGLRMAGAASGQGRLRDGRLALHLPGE